jgi:hypothetical protein
MSIIDTLNPEEARLYAAFKKNISKFGVMLDHGVFDVKEGKAEINIHNGMIQSVYLNTMTYRRQKEGGVGNSLY